MAGKMPAPQEKTEYSAAHFVARHSEPHPGFVLRQNLPSPLAGRGLRGGVKAYCIQTKIAILLWGERLARP